MSQMASQITSLTIVYPTVYSCADRRKLQSPASLTFVRGNHLWPVNSPHKWASNAKNVSIWWRHHEVCTFLLHWDPLWDRGLLHCGICEMGIKCYYHIHVFINRQSVLNLCFVMFSLMFKHIKYEALVRAWHFSLRSTLGFDQQCNKCFNISFHFFSTWARQQTTKLSIFLRQDVDILHYGDVIMGPMASQSTGLTIICTTVYPGADQRKHQRSASLALVRGIHRGPMNSLHKWPVTRKKFPLDDVIV